MFGNLLGWFGGGGNNQHNRPGGGGPGPIQTLILGYVAQQAIYYYFGDENDESDEDDDCGLGINLASQNTSTLVPIPQCQGWNKHRDKWNYLPAGVIFLPALATVYCDSYDLRGKQEKRLFKAIQYGLTHEVSNLIKNGVDVNARHPLGWTPLMVATINRHYDIVKLLVKNGANPNMGDNYINPHRTSQEKRLHAIEVLMIRDEEFSGELNNKATYIGFTALHYAVLIDNLGIAQLLIENGANPCLETEAGQKPLVYAKDGPMKEFLSQQTEKYAEIEREKELEQRRKFPLEDRLKKHIVGQEAAIATVAATVRRKENGWTDGDHPVVFLFLGSSGIGKTELAKQLAYYIHKDKTESFIRLDMSEFQEKHEVAKLIGAPPGYIGHDDGGQLTKKLKTCPDAVVLFDEVDKAHPDVLTVLLQLFDEGRLTDGQGKTIECKNAIFVMTSNLASQEIAHHALNLRADVEKVKEERLKQSSSEDAHFSEDIVISRKFKDEVVKPILKRHFKRDEFLGRINEIVYFLPFSRRELLQLVQRELECWAQRAKERHKIDIKWDRTVESALADGYDVCYGARSIKYEVERRVVNQLAAAHEKGVIGKGSSINITATWPEKCEYAEIQIQVKKSGFKDFIDIASIDKKPITNTFNYWSKPKEAKSNVCLVGKTAIVTGANTGIGYETAEDLAKRGARVILACRDPARGEDAAKKIIQATDNKNVEFKLLDLSSFKSIRQFASDIIATEERLDILVNNAGLGSTADKTTEDGLLLIMQVNYFGPFLLTNLLLRIGYETAEDLAKRGARVILACRDPTRGQDAAEKIIKATDNKNVEVKLLDLSSFKSIRQFASDIIATEERLDILVNNAGLGSKADKKTEDGLLLVMQANYFGPFLLTNLLLAFIKKTPNARIVNVASAAAKHAAGLDVQNLNTIRHDRAGQGFALYSRSKLCNILFTLELAKRLQGTTVTTYSLHPGVVLTDIMRRVPQTLRFIIEQVINWFCKSRLEGAQTTIYCSVAKEIASLSGRHFHDCHVVDTYKTAQDPDISKQLWKVSEEVVKLNRN
ncbi:hypothetical protein YQE_05659, partial [Dendroctonus ponderosae]